MRIAVILAVLYIIARSNPLHGMLIKAGVNLNSNVRGEMIPVLSAVESIWARYGQGPPTITDYYRSDPSSLHAVGLALDFRTYNIAPSLRETLAGEVSLLIGRSYEVILEDGTNRKYWRNGQYNGERHVTNSVPPHMHVEFDRPQTV